MVNPNQRLGIVEMTVGGEPLDIVPGSAEFDKGGYRRKTQNGDQGANFSQERVPAMAKADVYFGPKTSLSKYENMRDETVVVRCDTGQVYTMANAWLEGEIKPKAGAGGVHTLNFVAREAKESGV